MSDLKSTLVRGYPIRAVADALGVSVPRVHQIIAELNVETQAIRAPNGKVAVRLIPPREVRRMQNRPKQKPGPKPQGT